MRAAVLMPRPETGTAPGARTVSPGVDGAALTVRAVPRRAPGPAVDGPASDCPAPGPAGADGGFLSGAHPAVLAGLAAALVLAWAYLLRGAGFAMPPMSASRVPMMAPAWTTGYAARVFVMWTVMTAAMMLPGTAAAILHVAGRPRRRRGEAGGPWAATLFAAGAFVVWTAFGAAAALAHWGLGRAGVLSDTMAVRSPAVAAVILLAVGLYQLTPLKRACLRRCRAFHEALADGARADAWGIAAAGRANALAGVGCGGALTALLFVPGVMNVPWIAGLTVLMLAEQAVPPARPARFVAAARRRRRFIARCRGAPRPGVARRSRP